MEKKSILVVVTITPINRQSHQNELNCGMQSHLLINRATRMSYPVECNQRDGLPDNEKRLIHKCHGLEKYLKINVMMYTSIFTACIKFQVAIL